MDTNKTNEDIVIGRNAVTELIKSGKDINKILVAEGSLQGSMKKIIGAAKDKKIIVQIVDRNKLDEISNNSVHQGILAYVSAYKYFELDDILNDAKEKGEDPFIIITDGVEDPHNLGALIRTANCCGAHGVIIPKRRAAPLTSTVNKASAGAIQYTKVARVTNLVSTIKELKEKGIWIAGADMDGDKNYFETDLKGPIAVVVGGEDKGVSRLVKENCDFVVKIPMNGQINSLNVSVAGAVLMYEVVRQRLSK